LTDAELAAFVGVDMADLTEKTANIAISGDAKYKFWPIQAAVLRLIALVAPPLVILTANTVLTAAQSGSTVVNTGAAGAVNATLPAAVIGMRYTFILKAAQQFQILFNGAEKCYYGNALPAGGVHVLSSEIQATITLVCVKTGEWNVKNQPMGAWAIG
jgi:hypothetical protein